MIKNLMLQLNEAGKIKIGRKGKQITSAQGNEFRPPEKLDHFQLVTTEKDADGDFIVDTALENRIKEAKTGLVNESGNLTGIPIRLLYNDTELNFPTRLASYVSGKLSCTGDGETATKRIDDFAKEYPCPCPRFDQGYDGKDKCKAMGSLSCIIDEAGLFGQAHKFRTTSINSVKGILGGIDLINTATNGRIAGLPLMLTMNAKSTTTPQGHNTIVYVVSVCYRGSMSDLRNEVLRVMSEERQYLIGMDKLEADARMALDHKPMITEEEQLEIAEEFFPDTIPPAGPIMETKPEPYPKSEPEKHAPAQGSEEKDVLSTPEPPTGDDDTDLPGEAPAGPYKAVYQKLCEETDYDKAIALAKRLTKNNLVYWLIQEHPEIDIPDGAKKPELLELCEEAMAGLVGETCEVSVNDITKHPDYIRIKEISERKDLLDAITEYFKPVPIDRTATRDILLERVRQEILKREMTKPVTPASPAEPVKGNNNKPMAEKRADPEPTPEPTPEPEITPQPPAGDWDESGLIEKDQLRQMVKLKKDIEMLGYLDPTRPEIWSKDYVGIFRDADGNPHTTATKLSINQGNALIEKLELIIKNADSDDCPF